MYVYNLKDAHDIYFRAGSGDDRRSCVTRTREIGSVNQPRLGPDPSLERYFFYFAYRLNKRPGDLLTKSRGYGRLIYRVNGEAYTAHGIVFHRSNRTTRSSEMSFSTFQLQYSLQDDTPPSEFWGVSDSVCLAW